ncbi:hypothetical protein ACFLU9_00275 [Chloroflexota bacterium]
MTKNYITPLLLVLLLIGIMLVSCAQPSSSPSPAKTPKPTQAPTPMPTQAPAPMPTSDTSMWTIFSEMQVSLENDPTSQWQVSGTFADKTASAGILYIKTNGTLTGLFTHPEERFDNAVGSTVEIKMKLLEGPATDHDASLFSLQDGMREGKISFFSDRIEIRDQNTLRTTHKMDTGDGFHIYRLALVKDTFDVYVDGERVASITLGSQISNKVVIFGDGSIGQGENIGAQIEYIAYSIEGSVTPEGEAVIAKDEGGIPVIKPE